MLCPVCLKFQHTFSALKITCRPTHLINDGHKSAVELRLAIYLKLDETIEEDSPCNNEKRCDRINRITAAFFTTIYVVRALIETNTRTQNPNDD